MSVVAFALGCVDVARGFSHTILVERAAIQFAGLDLSGPSGLDQMVLMVAFGASNFLSGAALIYLALRDRFGALVFLALIPLAYLAAQIGLSMHAAGLAGQGVFSGRYMMAVYIGICLATVLLAAAARRRNRSSLSF